MDKPFWVFSISVVYTVLSIGGISVYLKQSIHVRNINSLRRCRATGPQDHSPNTINVDCPHTMIEQCDLHTLIALGIIIKVSQNLTFPCNCCLASNLTDKPIMLCCIQS